MKSKNLAEYANDEQEKQQLKIKGGKGGNQVKKPATPKVPTYETTGGMDPLVLNRRKGPTY